LIQLSAARRLRRAFAGWGAAISSAMTSIEQPE